MLMCLILVFDVLNAPLELHLNSYYASQSTRCGLVPQIKVTKMCIHTIACATLFKGLNLNVL